MVRDRIALPKKSKGDAAHAITKAGLSAIPILGGPATELFQHIVQPPLDRRRQEWMTQVGAKLKELEDRGIDIEQLSKNEEFISAVLQASQIAVRTHRQEKREALRNAIFNIASGQAPEESLQHMFFEAIDSFSTLHVHLLMLFQDPTPPPGVTMGSLSTVIEFNMPQLRGHTHIYGRFANVVPMCFLLNLETMVFLK